MIVRTVQVDDEPAHLRVRAGNHSKQKQNRHQETQSLVHSHLSQTNHEAVPYRYRSLAASILDAATYTMKRRGRRFHDLQMPWGAIWAEQVALAFGKALPIARFDSA